MKAKDILSQLSKEQQACLEHLRELVKAFDCDGLPWNAYLATKGLIVSLLGQKAADKFAGAIDATDNSFYLSDEGGGGRLWNDMLKAAAKDKAIMKL